MDISLQDISGGVLHTNQRLLVDEMQLRGISVDVFDAIDEIVIACLNDHVEFIIDRVSSIIPYAATLITGDKYYSKKILKSAGISVSAGQRFTANDLVKAYDYAHGMGYPLVVKPCYGSHGDQVACHLMSNGDVRAAINELLSVRGEDCLFLIEKHCEGNEYRLFYTKNGDYACLYKESAAVVGDAANTIETLIQIENEKRQDQSGTSLCLLRLDAVTDKTLGEQGYTLASVPKLNERVLLNRNANITTGGMSIDCTDTVHPEFISLADKALRLFPGLPYAGFDIIAEDISKSPSDQKYCIIEINSNPGIKMHHLPGKGKSQNVAAMIIDLIFPETKK